MNVIESNLTSSETGSDEDDGAPIYSSDERTDEEDDLLYRRLNVTNSNAGRAHFDQGLRLLLSYQHEEASHYFLACLKFAPDCALAHALVAICHSPNYNFKGEAYYQASFPHNSNKESGDRSQEDFFTTFKDEDSKSDSMMIQYPDTFPSQLFADFHSKLAVKKVEELGKKHRRSIHDEGEKEEKSSQDDDAKRQRREHHLRQHPSQEINEAEVMLINAIRSLNKNPGVDPAKAERINGYPYAMAMREVYKSHPEDAEVAYFFIESMMTLHAWNLFEYPTGRPLSDDVLEIKITLEKALKLHPKHVGLCHMYVHLCEMATYPEKALAACDVLRQRFPEAGHLLHMATHIDVLVGDYDSCVRWNDAAITADTKTMERSSETANVTSFYFGYIAHNYHMLIYGAILGAMEEKAMLIAQELNLYLVEETFVKSPELVIYLESYSAMDVHVLVRFGRWEKILLLALPNDKHLMLYRAACIHYAKAIAYANLGHINEANAEAAKYEELRSLPDTKRRILHNNTVADLLEVDSYMIKGEIAYFENRYEDSFANLRQGVQLQDGLNFDEPWGKMQPIRHALGGFLLKRGQCVEAEKVYREDLKRLPNNPWSLKGLIRCFEYKLNMEQPTSCCSKNESNFRSIRLSKDEITHMKHEMKNIERRFLAQRKSEWADYHIAHSCACCISKF